MDYVPNTSLCSSFICLLSFIFLLAVNCMGRTYSSSKVHVVGKGSREGSLKPADNIHHYGTPPIFTDELKNVKIKLGDTLTLGCQGKCGCFNSSLR